ncbi:MAG: Fis family transcriptional regulator [Chromatiaceae bacterium]|nr:MAG: Fis family transcriptional regulator [Chromatiaceae bacterium]
MIEQHAVVLSLSAGLVPGDPGLAEVEVQRQTSCGSCSAQTGCGVSLLDRLLGRRPQRLLVVNGAGVRVGETVVIGVPEGALLKAAVAAYLGPLAGLFAGALLVEGWFGSAAQGLTLVGAAAGFILALLGLQRYSRRLASDPRYRARLLRRESVQVSVPWLARPGD